MVHLSDLSWSQPGEEAIKTYEKGQTVKAKVLDIDIEKERVSLGIKQLESDPIEKAGPSGGALRKNSVVTGTVTEVNDGGIEVELEGGVRAFIRRADLARDRADQRPERFGKGDKVDALVTSIDKASRKVSLSIKAREISEEKEAVQQYGSSDSGASLGDILGAALKKKPKKKGRCRRGVIFSSVMNNERRGSPRAFFVAFRPFPRGRDRSGQSHWAPSSRTAR